MHLSEPITTLTDYAIALEAAILAGLLWRHSQQLSRQLWAIAFMATALAALAGGTCHGFAFYLESKTLSLLWGMMSLAISVASFMMLGATVISTLSKRCRTAGLLIISVKAIAHGFIGVANPDFLFVMLDYGSSMVLVGILQIFVWSQQRSPSAGWILTGIGVSGGAIGLLVSQWHIGKLQAPDLYHLGQMVALILFYQGARWLKDG